ncbi:MAG: hypothetical protein MZV64_16065 [Ignavibacteriales bacterium]|nr:hypothetical protein [Ignavibacteriales bacterium]
MKKDSTPEREEIISLFYDDRPLKTKEIAGFLGKTETMYQHMLKKILIVKDNMGSIY